MLSPAVSCVLTLLALQSPAAAPVAAPDDTAPAADDLVLRLGARLAGLRADVDALAADVARERSVLHDEVAGLERRRRELEERIALATLTTRELEAEAEASRTGAAAFAAAREAAQAPVRDVIRRLRAVQTRVPFRLHARRERLGAIERGLDGASPAAAAAAALWPVVLDEARLLQERGRIRQAITVDGTPVMAELAHVGPLVWWRAADGRGGVASIAAAGDEPRFIVVDDPESRQRLGLFFEALRRSAPAGAWLVPSPLEQTVGATP